MNNCEPVLVVHGTFAQKSKWFMRDGEFCRALNQQLKELGSAAECWSYLNGQDVEFGWSGANSEIERRMAGWDLLRVLWQLEKRADVEGYHLVAHSHGGNVVVNALGLLKPRKLRSATFLGCPFVETRLTAAKSMILWQVLPTFLLALCFYQVELENSASFSLFTSISLVALFVFAMGTLKLLGLGLRRRQLRKTLQRNNFRSFIMSSQYDEAYASLVTALEVRANRSKYAKTLIGRYKVFPDLNYWYLKWLNFAPPNGFRTSNWVAQFVGTVQRLVLLFQTGLAAIMFFPVLFSVYQARLYGLRIGLSAISAMASGDDLMDERITSISRYPKWLIANNLPISIAVDSELKARALAKQSNFLHDAYEVLGDSFPTSIAEIVRHSLVDEHVVHSQYYKHHVLISQMALAISGTRNPP